MHARELVRADSENHMDVLSELCQVPITNSVLVSQSHLLQGHISRVFVALLALHSRELLLGVCNLIVVSSVLRIDPEFSIKVIVRGLMILHRSRVMKD